MSGTQFHWIGLAPMPEPRVEPEVIELANGQVRVTGGGHDVVWRPTDGAWVRARGAARPRGAAGARRRPAIAATYVDRVATLDRAGVKVRLRHARQAPTSTPLPDGRVLVTGGFEQFTNFSWEDYDDSVEHCELVDFSAGTSENAGQLAHARHRHAALLLRCGAVMLIGGMHDDDGATATTELGLPDGFTAWDAFGPTLRARLRTRFDELTRKAMLARASELRRSQRLEDAVAVSSEAAARWPDHAETWAELGRTHALLERWSDAVAAYQRATQLDPEGAFDWGHLGTCLIEAGRAPEAEAALEQVVRLVGDGDTWTQGLARHAHDQLQFLRLQRGGESEVAREAHQPTSSLQWNNKGAAHVQTGRAAEALPCFDAALALDRDNHYAWHNKSLALAMLGRAKDAKRCANRAIALRDHATPALRSDAWVQHGIACHDLGQFAASVRSYDRALAAVETAVAHNNRGNSLLRLGKAEAALDAYRRAIAMGFDAWWGVACACCALDRLDEARAAEARALAADPSRARRMRADPDLAKLRPRRRGK